MAKSTGLPAFPTMKHVSGENLIYTPLRRDGAKYLNARSQQER